MRLLQLTVRGLLLYSIILVLISIPVSLLSIQAILNDGVDEAISRQSEEFMRHIRTFEYLADLEPDLEVFDQLSYNIDITPANRYSEHKEFKSISIYDSIAMEDKPFRQLQTHVTIKGKPYILTVQTSLVDNNQLILTIALIQIALSILLSGGLLILNRSLSQRLWKPFYKTLDRLRAYQLDKNESIQLEKSEIIEFDDLNKTVSHLTERNRKVFLDQKEFIENASHELQTPIAIFQAKLDTLMQNPSLKLHDAETLTELESTVQRMSRLNKNLLLLSKIDNEQFPDKENLDLSEMVQAQINALSVVQVPDNAGIHTSLAPFTITANRTLIEVLLTNLFHNAVRHNRGDKAIRVSLTGRTLEVVNTGTNQKLDLEKMSRRFVKQSDNPNSTGLGLAIIKKICDSSGYELKYDYQNETHTFAVVF
jgi:signal transduction histidine kinase